MVRASDDPWLGGRARAGGLTASWVAGEASQLLDQLRGWSCSMWAVSGCLGTPGDDYAKGFAM